MSSPEPLLSVDKVGVEFRLPGRPVARVLDEVSVTVAAGTVVAVVGESGSGKSTLGRVVTGTLAENGRIADGQVTLGGRTLTVCPNGSTATCAARRSAISRRTPCSA